MGEKQPIQGIHGMTTGEAVRKAGKGKFTTPDIKKGLKLPHLDPRLTIAGVLTLAALAGGAAKLSGVIGGGGDSAPDTASPGAGRFVDKNFPN